MGATCSARHLFSPPDIPPRSWWRIVVNDMHLGKYLQPRAFSIGVSVDDFIRDGRPDIVAAINSDRKLEEPPHGPSLEVFVNEGPR
jgi:hypothetical protein